MAGILPLVVRVGFLCRATLVVVVPAVRLRVSPCARLPLLLVVHEFVAGELVGVLYSSVVRDDTPVSPSVSLTIPPVRKGALHVDFARKPPLIVVEVNDYKAAGDGLDGDRQRHDPGDDDPHDPTRHRAELLAHLPPPSTDPFESDRRPTIFRLHDPRILWLSVLTLDHGSVRMTPDCVVPGLTVIVVVGDRRPSSSAWSVIGVSGTRP